MREIKFRVWDKISKPNRMKTWGQLQAQYNNISQVFNSEGFELMQYTGLKDKHGKEIYEGDIIRYEHSAVGSIVRVVQYKYGMYGIEGNVKGTQIPFANILDSTREVIGNIYEDKNLLEG